MGQELEMRSILVRVQQFWSYSSLPCSSVSRQLLKAAVHTRQQQGTNLQEQPQEKTAGEAQVVRQEVKSKEEQAGLEEVEEDIVELENLMRVNFLVVADEVELLVVADEEEQDSEK